MCETIRKYQKKAQDGLANIFETWAKIIIRCSVFFFIVCLGLLIYVGFGNKYAKKFDQFPWAPHVSQSYHTTLHTRKFIKIKS